MSSRGPSPKQLTHAIERWVWPDVPKNTWGPRGWNWLHTLAINYGTDPTPAERETARIRIINFIANLPCGECRLHASTYARAHPPDLSGGEALQLWVWRFHNDVNIRLGKKELSFADYRRAYADEICWANWHEGCLIRQG